MTEAEFQRQVIQLAKLYRWRLVHFRPGLTRSGKWCTATQGDVGFPDLVLVRDGVLIFAELKSEKGKLGPEQEEWLDSLILVKGIQVWIWRPSDWDHIVEVLK